MRTATDPERRFLDPVTLARIGDLELLARTVVEGFLSGLHRSPHLGVSLDFAEHRPYAPGDDLRRIDWRLFARTDRYYVKEFEADTNTSVTVLLDASRSMRFASGGVSKLDYGRFLGAALLHMASRQRDRVGFAAFDRTLLEYVPPSARHLPLALQAMARVQGSGQGSELAVPLRAMAEHVRRPSIVVLISDLYEEPGQVADAVATLRGRGNDLIICHVLDPAELELPYDEAASFEDLETGERLPVIPAQQRARYRALVSAHVEALQRTLGERGADYALFDTRQPLDGALFHYLAARAQRTRRSR